MSRPGYRLLDAGRQAAPRQDRAHLLKGDLVELGFQGRGGIRRAWVEVTYQDGGRNYAIARDRSLEDFGIAPGEVISFRANNIFRVKLSEPSKIGWTLGVVGVTAALMVYLYNRNMRS